jgi:hypothetical protein
MIGFRDKIYLAKAYNDMYTPVVENDMTGQGNEQSQTTKQVDPITPAPVIPPEGSAQPAKQQGPPQGSSLYSGDKNMIFNISDLEAHASRIRELIKHDNNQRFATSNIIKIGDSIYTSDEAAPGTIPALIPVPRGRQI